jgi:hypothetical protein
VALATIQFSTDPGKILDFSGHSPASVFNSVILPRVNSFSETLQQPTPEPPAVTPQPSLNVAQLLSPPQRSEINLISASNQSTALSLPKEEVDYDKPLPQKQGRIKLSNYGYDSDSSPDYNSNVLRIGHANNKLEDGVSAALTKSLASRYGLKTGDMFEAVTADGKILKRRYDDTVPPKYKGKSLPETVDLYERKGSNSFGGSIVEIRPLR